MWVLTKISWRYETIMGTMWRKHVKNVRCDTWFEIWGKVYYFIKIISKIIKVILRAQGLKGSRAQGSKDSRVQVKC